MGINYHKTKKKKVNFFRISSSLLHLLSVWNTYFTFFGGERGDPVNIQITFCIRTVLNIKLLYGIISYMILEMKKVEVHFFCNLMMNVIIEKNRNHIYKRC